MSNYNIVRPENFKIDELKKPIVSVIIPTYNSALTIERCINSVKEQTYNRYEILVIDNHSSDDTTNIAQRLGVNVIKYFGKRTSARNYGAKNAAGEYLFNIDSDMELTPYVIKECADKCENENVDALIIPEISIGEGYLTKCRALEKRILIGEINYEAARFLRKKVFEDIKGYDESLEAGEDFDIHYRIEDKGYSISRINSFIKHNEGKLTMGKIITKSKYYGKTVKFFTKKHKIKIKNQRSVPSLYIKKWNILVKNPILIPGLFFIKIVEFTLTGRQIRFGLNK